MTSFAEKLAKLTPGVFVIIAALIVLVTGDGVVVAVTAFWNDTVLKLDTTTKGALTTLFVIVTFVVVSVLTFLIDQVWDVLFYVLWKGHENPEYQKLVEKLLSGLPADSPTRQSIEQMGVQPVYGYFLHSFAGGDYIAWLRRRWDSFHNAWKRTLAIAIGAAVGLSLLLYLNIGLRPASLLSVAVFIAVLIAIMFVAGRKRRRELINSEHFLCLSIWHDDLNAATANVAQRISSRRKTGK